MEDFQFQFSNGLPTIDGFSSLQQTLTPYVTQGELEFQLQEFAQNVDTGVFTLPNPTEYFSNKPPEGNLDMNGKRIINLDSNIDLTSGIVGISSSALSLGLATQMFPNTGLQNLTDRVSMGSKIVGNVSNPVLEYDAVNLQTFQNLSVNRTDETSDFSAKNKKIYYLDNAFNYKNSDVFIPDPIEIGAFVRDPQLEAKYKSQAMNLQSVRDSAICLETDQLEHFDSKAKQIKNGKQATDAKDYVTLDQVVHQEVENLEWISNDPIPVQQSKYVFEDDRVILISNPREPVDGQFIKQNLSGSIFLSSNLQVANLGYVKSTCHEKNKDIDMLQFKVKNMGNPSENSDAVTKSYCDGNSKNPDGTGLLTNLLGGALGGALSSAVLSQVGSGISTFGQMTGALSAGTAALSTAMKVGSNADFDRYQASNGESQQLIDNLKDDIANGGTSSNQQPEGGGMFNGPLNVSGLFSASRNAQIGLFDLLDV